MKLLFICNQNQNRSKLAEELFKDKCEVRSRGLFRNEVTSEDLLWANIIFVMEEFQRNEISKRFPKEYLSCKIINLDILDYYNVNNKESKKELSEILKNKINNYLSN